MKLNNPMNIVALVLVIVGAINWGLVGAFDFNLVSSLLGTDTFLTNLIYILVGISGIYLLGAVAYERSQDSSRYNARTL